MTVKNNLKRIDSQEIMIEGILNEEYDDWYSEDDEEFYYEDNSGISDMLAGACDFVHTCIDMEKYKEGYELLHCDLKRVILDTAYCAYYAVPLKKRPEVLHDIVVNAGRNEITLEALMQHGDEELPDFWDFLTLWITYLNDKMGDEADRLIQEAVSLSNDASMAVQCAEKYADVHPGLYLNLLENRQNSNTVLLLRFLDGQYDEVLKKGLNKSEALGWTGTFMKSRESLCICCICTKESSAVRE